MDVEPGEPHRADDSDPERVAVLLEGALHVDPLAVGGLETLLGHLAMRLNVEIPVAELGNLALLFAHHDADLRFLHPGELAFQSQALFAVGRAGKLAFESPDMIAPVFLDQAVHPDGGDLVDGDEHRLAALPGRGVVRDEVPGDGVEALGRGDDVVVAFQFAFEALLYVDVIGLELFELLRDPFVEVVGGDAKLLASRVIVERHRGAVLHRALEPIPGDVVAEHPPG